MDENVSVQKYMDVFLDTLFMDEKEHVQESMDGFLCSIISL